MHGPILARLGASTRLGSAGRPARVRAGAACSRPGRASKSAHSSTSTAYARRAHQRDQLGPVAQIDRLRPRDGPRCWSCSTSRDRAPPDPSRRGRTRRSSPRCSWSRRCGSPSGTAAGSEAASRRRAWSRPAPPLVEGQQVQGAAGAGREARPVEEDAGTVDHPGLAPRQLAFGDVVGILQLDPAAGLGRPACTATAGPSAAEPPCGPASRRLRRRNGRRGAATVVGPVGVDAGAASSEDAGPARGEPGQVAAEDLFGVGRVDELRERARERDQHLWHGGSLGAG